MKAVTVADLLRFLLIFDRQVISPRPSTWGLAAELVHALAEHAEPSLREPDRFGDWREVDLSGVNPRAPRELSHPPLDRLTPRLRTESDGED